MADPTSTDPAETVQDNSPRSNPGDGPPTRRLEDLAPAARRALEEAEARRAAAAADTPPAPERAGRGGLEPVRYGDWEIKGLAADF